MPSTALQAFRLQPKPRVQIAPENKLVLETLCTLKLKVTAIFIIFHKDEKWTSVMLFKLDCVKHLDHSVC